MSEELKKFSVLDAFAQTAQTFAEAEEKAKQEAGGALVERFRISEDGTYTVRILPLAPNFDSEGHMLPMEKTGYEYGVHQIFLKIKLPNKGKGGKDAKEKYVNIPVICATDKGVGYSVDLIDTYLRIAKEMYSDDQDLIDLISGGSYGGGLRWNYAHAIMILDVSSEKERAKGPQLWQPSHSQYKEIDAARMRLWKELRADGEQNTCPVTSFTGGYPVKAIRETTNGKVGYTFEIGRKIVDPTDEELQKLLDLPRIPDQIYRYTRYQMEATLEFLKQYDEKHDMEVCNEPDFKEAVEKLKGELPADDNSHFNFSDSSSKSSAKVDEVTIDSLWVEYDAIADQGLSEKSDEYQELREKIRQFIEDKNLDVRISRTKNNGQLLNEVDEALSSTPKTVKEVAPVEPEVKEEEPVEPEDEPEAPRRRHRRPSVEEEPEEEVEEAPEEKVAEPEEGEEEDRPRRRLHNRRR